MLAFITLSDYIETYNSLTDFDRGELFLLTGMFKTNSQGLKIMGLPFWMEMGKLFGIDLRYCLEPLNFSA